MHCSKIESGVQLFSRVSRKPYLQGINSQLFPEDEPHPNQIIEITGAPHIDKTNLIVDFIVKCILPNKYNDEWKGSAAIFINTEFQISLFKIIKVMEILIKKHEISDSRKIIIETALKNLTMFNCYNLEELEGTFYNLEKVIHNNENISLVVIDNIATQYWIARFNTDMLSYYHHSLKNFEILYNVIKDLQVVLIFVQHATNKKNFSQKVDFKIEIGEDINNYKATVINYEKQTDMCIKLKLDPFLEILV